MGGASKMGKVVAAAPALSESTMQGAFKADLGAMRKLTPDGIGGPNSILKKFIR